MEERDPKRLPNRDEHSLRVYSAIVGPPKPVNGHVVHRRPGPFGRFALPEWTDVQRLVKDSSLPPHVRARIAPLLEQAHKCWCEAFQRCRHHPERHGRNTSNGRLSTKQPNPM